MTLTGLHFLLTLQCNFECDHCFVWGSPRNKVTFTFPQIEDILDQAVELGTIKTMFFEGGEPFLYFSLLRKSIKRAHELGFRTGIVSNAFWAPTVEEAIPYLKKLASAGLDMLQVSSDQFHRGPKASEEKHPAVIAARKLGIDASVIAIDPPGNYTGAENSQPGEPISGGEVLYRGRAVEHLAADIDKLPWRNFDTCPHETLSTPARVHVDPYGNLHLCQGLVMGNVYQQSLSEIFADYNPGNLPVISQLLTGGAASIVETYQLPHEETYVDACHLCYTAREQLRDQFPQLLTPNAMYGILE